MERIESISIEAEERGWEIVVETDGARYRFHAHGIASSGELRRDLGAVLATLDEWETEGREAAAAHVRDLASKKAADRLSEILEAEADERARRDVC